LISVQVNGADCKQFPAFSWSCGDLEGTNSDAQVGLAHYNTAEEIDAFLAAPARMSRL
jgi:selenocysteine lyase/cysteine desulfurase